MRLSALFFAGALLAVSVSAGCGEKKKDAQGEQKGDKAGPPTSGAPSKDEVGKIDCDKACGQQMECIKKNGMKVDNPEQAVAGCKMGCDAMKGSYDPAMHGDIAKNLIKLASGSCD
jgi:hypothetical protein